MWEKGCNILVVRFSREELAFQSQPRCYSTMRISNGRKWRERRSHAFASFSASGICLSASLEKSLSGLSMRPSDIVNTNEVVICVGVASYGLCEELQTWNMDSDPTVAKVNYGSSKTRLHA